MAIKSILSETHDSPENAYICMSYPYGRNRCLMRYWIETSKSKGCRFVSQTTISSFNYRYTEKMNDDGFEEAAEWAREEMKAGRVLWNKPKPSTYQYLSYLGVDHLDHIIHIGVPTPSDDYLVRARDEYYPHLSPVQKAKLIKLITAYNTSVMNYKKRDPNTSLEYVQLPKDHEQYSDADATVAS
jgi:hypothetical protein